MKYDFEDNFNPNSNMTAIFVFFCNLDILDNTL